jgi:hypothetical protein
MARPQWFDDPKSRDPADGLPIILDSNGNSRPLGLVPPPEGLMLPMSAPLVDMPESEYREFDLRENFPNFPVKDQNGKGACNGHAVASAAMLSYLLQAGRLIELSAWYVYAILCNGVDRGSSIEEGLLLGKERGICLDPSVPYATINPRKISDAAHEEAKRFKIDIGSPIRNFNEMMTATQLRRPGNTSVCAGSRFNQMDANGVSGVDRGYGNHAVMFGWGAKKINGVWHILNLNSWGNWGRMKGWFWTHAGHYDHAYFSAYANASMHFDPKDQDRPNG